MASVSKHSGGYRIKWYQKTNSGKQSQKSIFLKNKTDADVAAMHIEAILFARKTNSPLDPATRTWLTTIGDDLATKMERAGLIEVDRGKDAIALGQFLQEYIDSRVDVAENTTRNYKQSKRYLVDFFTANKQIGKIRPSDADRWQWDMNSKFSQATVSMATKHAKRFFKHAVRQKLIDSNPFADLPVPTDINRSRDFFVKRTVIDAILNHCPDAEWKLIIALCRYGGFRCPSEVLAIQWSDIDWGRERLTVYASKNRSNEDGGYRVCPIFPELRPYLEAGWNDADDGDTWIVKRYRESNSNLRTQFERIIKRAGQEQWPKLFQNLRASRDTELHQVYPAHVVAKWMGHSTKTAAGYYLQVTEEHMRQGASETTLHEEPAHKPKPVKKRQKQAKKGD